MAIGRNPWGRSAAEQELFERRAVRKMKERELFYGKGAFHGVWSASAASGAGLLEFPEKDLPPLGWLEDQLYRVRRRAWA